MAHHLHCRFVDAAAVYMPLLLQASMPGIRVRHGTNFPIQTFGRWGWWLQSKRDLGASGSRHRIGCWWEEKSDSEAPWAGSIGLTEWPSLSTPMISILVHISTYRRRRRLGAAPWLLLCSCAACCFGECRAVADQLEPNRKPSWPCPPTPLSSIMEGQ